MVVHDLPKVRARVRFPYFAQSVLFDFYQPLAGSLPAQIFFKKI